MNTRRKNTGAYHTQYTPAEDAAIRAQYAGGDKASILAALPGRSWHSVEMRAGTIGVKRLVSKLSVDELVILDQLYATVPNRELLILFPQLTIDGLSKMALRRGLRKDVKPAQPRVAKVAAPRPPKPPKMEIKPPSKRAPKTPNANAQKAVMEGKKRVNVPITAEEFKRKRVPMYSEEWWSFTNQGYRGWAAYQAKQAA